MRVEMLFDGGRLHVLPLKETSAPTLGSPSVENGFTTAGEITSGTCEITSLETGDVVTGAMDVDPDGLSASIDLGSVGPGRVLVQGKLQLASTGTSEMFGGFTHFHLPVASSAGPPQQTALGKFKAGLMLVALLVQLCVYRSAQADEPAPSCFAEDERSASACQCAPACECGSDCRCGAVALADEVGATAAEAGGGNVRRAALKMFLRRQATKAFLRGDRAKAKQLRAALDDDDALDSIGDAIAADSKLSPPKGADGAIVDQIIKFLEWLLSHADEILALVMKIIPLFAEPAQPAAALLDVPAGWQELPLAVAC